MIASIRGKKPHVYRVIILKQMADHKLGAARYKFKALGYYKEQKAYSNSWKWHVAGPANGTIMASN